MYSSAKKSKGTQSDASLQKKELKASSNTKDGEGGNPVLHKIEEDGEKVNDSTDHNSLEDDSPLGAKSDVFKDDRPTITEKKS